jgi:hypothetical protein
LLAAVVGLDHKAEAVVVLVVEQMAPPATHARAQTVAVEDLPTMVEVDLVDQAVEVALTVDVDVLVALVHICRVDLLATPILAVEEDIMEEDLVDLTSIQTPEVVAAVDQVY